MAGYSSSVDDLGSASSGNTQTVGGGITSPAINKGSSWVPLALGTLALAVALVALFKIGRR